MEALEDNIIIAIGQIQPYFMRQGCGELVIGHGHTQDCITVLWGTGRRIVFPCALRIT